MIYNCGHRGCDVCGGKECPVCERDNEIKGLECVIRTKDDNVCFLKQLLADFKATLFSLSQKFEKMKEEHKEEYDRGYDDGIKEGRSGSRRLN